MNVRIHIAIGVFLLAVMMLLCRCSPSGRSLLVFFFDGVPETDTLAVQYPEQGILVQDTVWEEGEAPVPGHRGLAVHYPYGERECNVCHDPQALGSMTEPQPELCYQCHEDQSLIFPVLHGPVAGGYCTACHDPHSSENDMLLRIKGNGLCFFCHSEMRLRGTDMHSDMDGMICTECHNPHGGEDRYLFQ